MPYEYALSWDLPSVSAANAMIISGRGQLAQAPPTLSGRFGSTRSFGDAGSMSGLPESGRLGERLGADEGQGEDHRYGLHCSPRFGSASPQRPDARSALAPFADSSRTSREVREVPAADICTAR